MSYQSARTRAREFALQALYQHIVGLQPLIEIQSFTRELSGFHKADHMHYEALVVGCVDQSGLLDQFISPKLDRPITDLSPIEHAVLWMGVYELKYFLEIPWRVVINEYVELSKRFGGTDGYRYINGVLNTLLKSLNRPDISSLPVSVN